ncbi:hypothetical protein KSP35_19080 [Aquihabitans sp. G128]|uniref:hypothetical protein n=1 Tax=Aquihabitans sp. G128 TaxID=2849779 RepID=UPI001C23DCB5|nr:hypothetical protein [Aquihabitans sp. G128]QXC60409.1 hypothetical protein KSP35_19080 [Aquihabitans sp. G128]
MGEATAPVAAPRPTPRPHGAAVGPRPGRAGAARRAAPRRGRRRTAHGPRWALALAALGSAAWTAALASVGGFYYDDFWNLTVAHDLGWGWSFLGRPVFGHVIPGANAMVGLVAGPGGFHHGWAVATLAVLAAPIPVLGAAAARALGARPWPAVAAGVVASSSAGLAAASGWWSAGLNLYPSVLGGMGLVVGFGVARSGRRWGAPVAAAALGVGLACSEGAAVFLVVPVVLAVGTGSGPLFWRLVRTWGRPSGWVVVATPLLAAVVARASAAAPLGSAPRAPLADVASFPLVFLARGFLPSLVGLTPGRVDLLGRPVLSVLAGVVGLVVAGLALRDRLRPGFAVPVVAVALVVAARAGLVAWSRLALLGWDDAVELRYHADLAWLVPVLVAAWWQPAGRRARSTPARRRRLVLAVGVVAALGLVGQVVTTSGEPARASRAYRDRLATSWADQPSGTAVLDALVPAEVLGPQFGEFLFLSRTVARGGLDLRYGPASRVVAPDGSGRLVPVRLGPVADLLPDAAFTAAGEAGVDHRGGCWVARDRPALVWVPLSRPVLPAAWVLDLRLAGRSATAVSFVAAGQAPAAPIAASPEGRGRRRWVVTTVPFTASQVGFAIPAGERFCLASGVIAAAEARP